MSAGATWQSAHQSLKSPVEHLRRLIAAEREAYGMDKDRTSDAADLSGASLSLLRRMRAELESGR